MSIDYHGQVTAVRGSLRRQVRIAAGPDAIWAIVGDAGRLAEWWPGITSCSVVGDVRVVTTASGLPMPERILTVDRVLRRFQYRITAPIVTEHTSTIDVLDLGDNTSLVVYSIDANPSAMALIVGGAAGNALEHLRRTMEGNR